MDWNLKSSPDRSSDVPLSHTLLDGGHRGQHGGAVRRVELKEGLRVLNTADTVSGQPKQIFSRNTETKMKLSEKNRISAETEYSAKMNLFGRNRWFLPS